MDHFAQFAQKCHGCDGFRALGGDSYMVPLAAVQQYTQNFTWSDDRMRMRPRRFRRSGLAARPGGYGESRFSGIRAVMARPLVAQS